jgi:iron-sulfur cluster assembly protein
METTTTTLRRPRPAPVIVTEGASNRIAAILQDAPADAVGVRLSTPRRGCSGLAYDLAYVTAAKPGDERIDTPGGVLFIDGGSLMYLIGSTMDWREDDFSAGFVFNNPNAKGSCGCGESFTV